MNVSAQKYKVFFNNVLVLIEDTDELAQRSDGTILMLEHDICNSSNWEDWLKAESKTILWAVKDVDRAFEHFKTYFKIVKAAGGLVVNQNEELLAIFRNGKWDLPKGKLEKGEEINECAVREVEEETAVSVSSCSETNFDITYHVYFHKKAFILKSTHWYIMKSKTNVRNLLPQSEEGIDKVEWKSTEEILILFKEVSYRSIYSLIQKYFSI
ncbi:NUDIX domain-containing protein [Salibacteraceae bacterium]|nr:NUDIX hydrolase [Crocinitomicaceae bacterium]MDA9938416.1 NUDIX domain-containing protein [Salibacteraceae bacterium]|tara:strand:+ start:119129 stop:119764 length:636 start_codon:yes stop_codon:yes gene_type:complete